ncbi:MAG: hypothetical protein QG579_10 [Patescibacteria group bacterium]|nr:hypothetical protein [Patescibacteria group bacterium]
MHILKTGIECLQEIILYLWCLIKRTWESFSFIKIMKNKLIIKTVVIFFFIISSFLMMYPACKSLVINGGLGSGNSVVFSVNSQNIQSILRPVGFPIISEFESYNIDISNLNNKYDISYILTFDDNDPILNYIDNIASSSEVGMTDKINFPIAPGKSYKVKDIPINIAMTDKFGSLSLCGFNSATSNCPNNLEQLMEISQKNIKIFACPNIEHRILIVEFILICVFWVLAFNSFYEFLKN